MFQKKSKNSQKAKYQILIEYKPIIWSCVDKRLTDFNFIFFFEKFLENDEIILKYFNLSILPFLFE